MDGSNVGNAVSKVLERFSLAKPKDSVAPAVKRESVDISDHVSTPIHPPLKVDSISAVKALAYEHMVSPAADGKLGLSFFGTVIKGVAGPAAAEAIFWPLSYNKVGSQIGARTTKTTFDIATLKETLPRWGDAMRRSVVFRGGQRGATTVAQALLGHTALEQTLMSLTGSGVLTGALKGFLASTIVTPFITPHDMTKTATEALANRGVRLTAPGQLRRTLFQAPGAFTETTAQVMLRNNPTFFLAFFGKALGDKAVGMINPNLDKAGRQFYGTAASIAFCFPIYGALYPLDLAKVRQNQFVAPKLSRINDIKKALSSASPAQKKELERELKTLKSDLSFRPSRVIGFVRDAYADVWGNMRNHFPSKITATALKEFVTKGVYGGASAGLFWRQAHLSCSLAVTIYFMQVIENEMKNGYARSH